ncbi:hypothetical protein PVL29_007331 [Vitis rotundifolia]|uniref:Exonuclease V, chloroplastic n=1 Tax=Vitis rotundifolia TaxID=103349 RepID=A0AA39A0B9_VITRO|nr:hypothetical protein PVL29_007331 [Vitis rotundifolia]
MTESDADSAINVPEIPVEIVTDEEMGLIEAALTAGRSSLSSSTIPAISSAAAASSSSFSPLLHRNARSIGSIARLSKRRLSDYTDTSPIRDIEDSGVLRSTQKKIGVRESLLHRFRRKKGLSVTDITGTEWCEKQMEFLLLFGKPEITKAMKAGIVRHAKLEEEVVKKVKVRVGTLEDVLALKFINFIVGVNQLLFEGLTRELPLIGFVEGVWMVGVIDEIRMPETEANRNPILVETKTRSQARSPAEPQQRNGRLQLMCYKCLWDSLAANSFPSRQFYDFFALNPHYILSEEIRENTANSGFPAKTLDDLLRYFSNMCCMLPPADDQLLLRYEYQEDHSLLGEDQFMYDSDWAKRQIRCCLEFWLGERGANYTPVEERWKCRYSSLQRSNNFYTSFSAFI